MGDELFFKNNKIDYMLTYIKITFRLLLVFFSFQALVWATDSSPNWYSKGNGNQVVINVALYLSSTCPHCKHVDVFFQELESKIPYLHVQRYFINQDKEALIHFNQLLSEQQQSDFSVPSVYICNSRWVGFTSSETTGKDLLHAINYCKKQIEDSGQLTQTTIDTLRHWAYGNRFSTGIIKEPSQLGYLFSAAFLDSFNPCSLVCFSGFLAFLFISDRWKKQLIAGLLFLSAVVMIHYVGQAYTSHFFQLISWLRIPSFVLGLITIYFVIRLYQKKTQLIEYYLLAFLLGLVITAYQQTCLMSWATIFDQWLNNQSISTLQANLYQLIYQFLYVVPLIVILFICLMMLQMKRLVRLRMKLRNIGLLFLLVIALGLLVYPYIFSNLMFSLLVLLILIVCGYFIKLT
jgi:hypothetical protein